MSSGIQYLAELLSIDVLESELKLEEFVDHLMRNHPEKLTWVLYRLDVDEHELKEEIARYPNHEKRIISEAILQKLKATLDRNKEQQMDTPDWSFDLD